MQNKGYQEPWESRGSKNQSVIGLVSGVVQYILYLGQNQEHKTDIIGLEISLWAQLKKATKKENNSYLCRAQRIFPMVNTHPSALSSSVGSCIVFKKMFFQEGLAISQALVRFSNVNEPIIARISLREERSKRPHIHFCPLVLVSPGA